jgi:hypothetical protein
MFDIRYASSADLDRLNAQMREWKLRESADTPPQSDQDENSQIPTPGGCDQLELFPM